MRHHGVDLNNIPVERTLKCDLCDFAAFTKQVSDLVTAFFAPWGQKKLITVPNYGESYGSEFPRTIPSSSNPKRKTPKDFLLSIDRNMTFTCTNTPAIDRTSVQSVTLLLWTKAPSPNTCAFTRGICHFPAKHVVRSQKWHRDLACVAAKCQKKKTTKNSSNAFFTNSKL